MIQKRICDRCGKDFFETYKEWLCRACMNELGWECTPKTNADHIRSMSNEELAEFLCSVYDEEEDCAKFINGIVIPAYSEQDIEGWLKQPYKEET